MCIRDSSETALINRLVNQRELDESDDRRLQDLWNRIVSLDNRIGCRLMLQLKLYNRKEAFVKADIKSKRDVILGLLNIINAASNMVDFSVLSNDGKHDKCVGNIRLNYSKLLSDPGIDFYVIDQSVTGMFERRTRIGF